MSEPLDETTQERITAMRTRVDLTNAVYATVSEQYELLDRTSWWAIQRTQPEQARVLAEMLDRLNVLLLQEYRQPIQVERLQEGFIHILSTLRATSRIIESQIRGLEGYSRTPSGAELDEVNTDTPHNLELFARQLERARDLGIV